MVENFDHACQRLRVEFTLVRKGNFDDTVVLSDVVLDTLRVCCVAFSDIIFEHEIGWAVSLMPVPEFQKLIADANGHCKAMMKRAKRVRGRQGW